MAGIPAARMSALAWGLAGALSAFTAILTAPDPRLHLRRDVRPRPAAARARRRGAGPDEQPADRARRRSRSRHPRAAAAVEQAAVRPGRGGPVRHHPARPCCCRSSAADARRRRAAGPRCRRCARCPRRCASCGWSATSACSSAALALAGRGAAPAVHQQQPTSITLVSMIGVLHRRAVRRHRHRARRSALPRPVRDRRGRRRGSRTRCRTGSATSSSSFLYAGLARRSRLAGHRSARAAHPRAVPDRHDAVVRAGHAGVHPAAGLRPRGRRRPWSADHRRPRRSTPASSTTRSLYRCSC